MIPVDILLNQPQYISCHDFVLSTIHIACHQQGYTIPEGLDIPPHLAWPDLLFAACRVDDAIHLTEIRKIYWPNIDLCATLTKQDKQPNINFFSGSTTPQKPQGASGSYCCIM